VASQFGFRAHARRGVGVLGAEAGLDAAQGEAHHGEAAGGGNTAASAVGTRAAPVFQRIYEKPI